MEGRLFIVEDTVGATFFNNPLAVGEGIRSLIAVPLKIQEKMVGILYLDDFVPRTFPEGRLKMLSVLASFASMSIDNARLHAQTRALACTDGLTGLYNHRQFMQMLEEQLNRAERYAEPLSLLMFDVDNFKKFNDTYGHPTGDKVLITVGCVLRKSLRSFDLSFRYGGEEFVAILPDTDIKQAVRVAERIRSTIERESKRMLTGVADHGVTVSVGVASYPRDGSGAELLDVVDKLLYKAKAGGKNMVHFHPEAD
jgi:diguanylate cyclase (GGDEF)-like protein